MDDTRPIVGVAGLFDDQKDLLDAAARVRDAGWPSWDCHTPYPVHGLNKAMGLKDSPIPYWTIGAGFIGAALGLLLQWWTSVVDYPLVIAGKPLFSWPAFVPITFEAFVLCAALTTTAALLVYCRLLRWHSPLHDAGIMAQVTTTRFAVYLDANEDDFGPEDAQALLEDAGCSEICTVFEAEDDGRFLP